MATEITPEIASQMQVMRAKGMYIADIARHFKADKMDTRDALKAEAKPKRGRSAKTETKLETD